MIDDEGTHRAPSRRWARAGGPTAMRVATPRVEPRRRDRRESRSSTTAAPPAARPDAPQGAALESAPDRAALSARRRPQGGLRRGAAADGPSAAAVEFRPRTLAGCQGLSTGLFGRKVHTALLRINGALEPAQPSRNQTDQLVVSEIHNVQILEAAQGFRNRTAQLVSAEI